MSRVKKVGILAAAGALLLATAGAGSAKPLLQEDFRDPRVAVGKPGRIVPHGKGFAWQGPGGSLPAEKLQPLSYDVTLNPIEGTIEFDLIRGERRDAQNEELFNLVSATGKNLFALHINWELAEGGIGNHTIEGLTDPPILFFATPAKGKFRSTYLQGGLGIRRNLPVGKPVHLAFTWGSAGVKVYLDGRVLDGKAQYPLLFKELAKKTAKIQIGARVRQVSPPRMNTARSLIANVQVHDVQLKPSQFAQPIVGPVAITSVSQNSSRGTGFSGKLVAGDKLQVTVQGTTGVKGGFDVVHYPDIAGRIDVDWRGWGVYLENKAFFAENEVNLRDVNGYRVYAATSPIGTVTAETVPVATLKVGEQTYALEHLLADTPYYVAVYAEKRDGTLMPVVKPLENLPLAETSPGVYTGEYSLGYRDRFARAVVVGRLWNSAHSASLVDPASFVTDPALVLTVGTAPSELKADEKGTSQVTVTVTNANGDPVSGHKVRFLLATTSQYTGVVGGGAFADQVGGSLTENHWGETDLFGRVTATYVVGFAAKTAIIVARDMVSNDTGSGWVKTYIQASAELELQPLETPLAARGYEITVTSSDEWLTADGKSQARIAAKVTQGGRPVEGHRISFGLSSANGSIRTVKDTTDKNGEARAVYTAGKKIGTVLITATDLNVNISGSVQIELRSDAPAKINIKLQPEKLPADGRSMADLVVRVTDINDNPNDNTEVEYALGDGNGRLRDDKSLTDKNGETRTQYVAGRTPGRVSIGITVRSTVPTPEEQTKARGLALAVTDYNYF